MKKISTATAHAIRKVESQRLTIGLDLGDRSSSPANERNGDLSPITSLSSVRLDIVCSSKILLRTTPTVLECRLEARTTPPYLPRNCAPKELFRCALVLCSPSCLHFAHLLLVRRLKPFSP